MQKRDVCPHSGEDQVEGGKRGRRGRGRNVTAFQQCRRGGGKEKKRGEKTTTRRERISPPEEKRAKKTGPGGCQYWRRGQAPSSFGFTKQLGFLCGEHRPVPSWKGKGEGGEQDRESMARGAPSTSKRSRGRGEGKKRGGRDRANMISPRKPVSPPLFENVVMCRKY